MTRRPIFPESRTRSFCAAVALMFVLVALLLAAGCSGDCPDVLHTATMTKLDSDGTITWTKVLDRGLSNTISGMVPTSDGGFVTAGSVATTHSYCTLNYQARFIRFTGTGEILWDRVFTTGEGNVGEIIGMHDGGFAALIDGSEIYRLDPDGRTVWNRSTGYSSLYSRSIIHTGDGGLIVAGPVFVKFDSFGNILWQRSYENETSYDIFFIHENTDDTGFIGFRISEIEPHEVYFINFDKGGNIINTSQLFSDGHLIGHNMDVTPNGYRLLYSDDKQGTIMMHLDIRGTVTHNQKINGSEAITLIKDKGLLSIDKTGYSVEAIKLNPDGTRSWNSTIPNVNLRNLRIIQVIQTTDGGFVIASDNGVEKDVSMVEQA